VKPVKLRELSPENKRNYDRWSNMKQRCRNPTSPEWKNYGARGIGIHKRWDSFWNFCEDIGVAPPGKSLDRIDNNGDYGPDNFRWATPSEQTYNRRKYPRTKYKVTPQVVRRARSLQKKGFTTRAVAKTLGIGKTSAHKIFQGVYGAG